MDKFIEKKFYSNPEKTRLSFHYFVDLKGKKQGTCKVYGYFPDNDIVRLTRLSTYKNDKIIGIEQNYPWGNKSKRIIYSFKNKMSFGQHRGIRPTILFYMETLF